MQRRRLLLSTRTQVSLVADLQRALDGSDVQVMALEDVAGETSVTVDAAFISRDITGLSLKAACWKSWRPVTACCGVHLS